MIWLLANIHFDDGLLRYFLDYYEKRGVERFGIILHSWPCPAVLNRPEIHVRVSHEPYVSGPRDNELLNEIRDEYLSPGDWYIPADLDEFHYHPRVFNFRDLVGDYDYIPSLFVDRIAEDGKIRDLDFRRSLDDQFPLASIITQQLCGNGCINKVAFARWNCVVNSGHHFAVGTPADFFMETHHFKWSSSFWRWINHREKLAEDVSSKEARPFTRHYQIHGRINIYDANLKIWTADKIGI